MKNKIQIVIPSIVALLLLAGGITITTTINKSRTNPKDIINSSTKVEGQTVVSQRKSLSEISQESQLIPPNLSGRIDSSREVGIQARLSEPSKEVGIQARLSEPSKEVEIQTAVSQIKEVEIPKADLQIADPQIGLSYQCLSGKLLMKPKERRMWSGYAAAQALIRAGGKDVEQNELDKFLNNKGGNVFGPDIKNFIDEKDLVACCEEVTGSQIRNRLMQVLNERELAIIGKFIKGGTERRWLVAQKDPDDSTNYLWIHNPESKNTSDGMIIPERISFDNFLVAAEMQWDVITLK